MPDRDQMRLFLKGYTELCSRRRAGIDRGVESALRDIINELETNSPPSLENLLYFESAFEKAEVKDAHLRYLHCVLKGYRERQYRSFAEGSGSPAL